MKNVSATVDSAKATVVDGLDPSVGPVRFRFDPLYSGGPAFIDGFDAPAYVDLSKLKIDAAPKALLEHDQDRVVGRLENVEISATKIVCDAVVGGNETARKVVEWQKNVADWSCSVGVYRIEDDEVDVVPRGKTAPVNGRVARGPCYIVRGGYLAEGSFVAIPGDGEARAVRAKIKLCFASKRTKETKGNAMSDYRKSGGAFAASDGGAPDDDKDAEKKDVCAGDDADEKRDEGDKLEAAEPDATDAPPDAGLEEIVEDAVSQAVDDAGEIVPEDVVRDVAEEIVDELESAGETDALAASSAAERKAKAKIKTRLAARRKSSASASASRNLAENRRVAALKELCGAYGREGARVAARAIEGGWNVDRAERLLKATARNRKATAGFSRLDPRSATSDRPRLRDVVAAAFAQSCGMTPKRVQSAFGFDERVLNESQERPWRGATFRTVVAASLNSFQPGAFGAFSTLRQGWKDCRAECFRARLLRGGAFRASANFSTFSATDVFQLVLQAFLEPNPDLAPRLYTRLTREDKVVDFNEVKSYLPTIQGRLEEIAETGAIQRVSFKTEEFVRSAKPYGATFSIPEQTIINDRLDVFSELLRQLETLGEDCLEHDVAKTFWRLVDGDIKDSSNASLVSASVGNYISSGALSEDGIGAAITALSSFSNGNGIPLATDKLLLVTGSKLAPTARKLCNAGYVDFSAGTVYENVWRGRFEPLEWAYFDKAHAREKKDDNSTDSLFKGEKTWIMLRDPRRRPAVAVAKVLGYESPTIEQFDAGPDVWGTTYRYVFPYGVAPGYKDAIVATTNS